MKKLLHNNKAFTLIEVITTITILSIIMAIAVGAIDGLVKNSKKKAMTASANNYVSAINLAIVQEEIESSHQVLEGSIYQQYMKLNDSLDQYSDILIEDSKLQQANFCFKDGLVTYSNGEYKVYLNDDCQQSVISDTVTSAFNVDKENQIDGVPVFVGEMASSANSSYEEATHKLYMLNTGVNQNVSPISNESNSLFCKIDSKNCDYRCIDGTITYDEQGKITRKTDCRIGTQFRGAALNQKDLKLSWALAIGYSLDSYIQARAQAKEFRLVQQKHLDYILSSDGLNIGANNPYLYKSFCNNQKYENSESIYNYCKNVTTQNRNVGTSYNYMKSKHLILNGIYPFTSGFSVALDVTPQSKDGIKDTTILDEKKSAYNINEYLKYGAVDFKDASNANSNVQRKISNIKMLLTNYSGVIIVSGYGENFEFYNKDKNIIYQPVSDSKAIINQALTIVGWDDEKVVDGKRGAWIAITANGSHTTLEEANRLGVNQNGFVYVSYYDYGYLSNEHYAFIKIEKKDEKNHKYYSIYNSSYEQTQGSTSLKLRNIVGEEYATNIIFDRIDSNNYKETISQIKIFNQFSAASHYTVYLKQNEVYTKVGSVSFNDNQAGLKTIELFDKIKVSGDKIDIVVTVSSNIPVSNLVISPDDIVLITETTNTEEIDIKILDVEDKFSKEIKLNILTNNIPTGEELEFKAVSWDGRSYNFTSTSTTVINDFYQAAIVLGNTQKHTISVWYKDQKYDSIIVNSSYDAKPICSFLKQRASVYKDSTITLTLECEDDRGINGSNLTAGLLFGDFSITWNASIKSISPPSCGAKRCSWDIEVVGKRIGTTNLTFSSDSIRDTSGQGNYSTSIEINVLER